MYPMMMWTHLYHIFLCMHIRMKYWVFLYLMFSRWCMHFILISSFLYYFYIIWWNVMILILLLLLYILWVNSHICAWKCVPLTFRFYSLLLVNSTICKPLHLTTKAKRGQYISPNPWWFIQLSHGSVKFFFSLSLLPL